MEMGTWRHEDVKTWRHGRGDVDMETWRHEDMKTWTWRCGHGDVDMETWIKILGNSDLLRKKIGERENESLDNFLLFVYRLLDVHTEVCRLSIC